MLLVYFPIYLKKGGILGGVKQDIDKRCPQMKLKDSECKNAKGKAKPYKLGDGKGLYLEVTPKGAKYWRLNALDLIMLNPIHFVRLLPNMLNIKALLL